VQDHFDAGDDAHMNSRRRRESRVTRKSATHALAFGLATSGCAAATTPTPPRERSVASTARATSGHATPPPTTPRSDALADVRALTSLAGVLRRDDPRRPVTLQRLADRYVTLAAETRTAALQADENAGGVGWPPRPAQPAVESDAPLPEEPPGAALRIPDRDAVSLARIRPEARRLIRLADEYTVRARAVYRQLVAEHPAAANADASLFALAEAERDLGEPDVQRRMLMVLLRQFPASADAADAYLVFAERFFELADMANAAIAYERVLSFSGARVGPYARYKLAWVQFNVQDHAHALDTMVRAAHEARAAQQPQILVAALREIPMMFAAAHANSVRADDAQAVFARAADGDRDRVTRMMDVLQDHLRDEGRWREALDVLHALVTRSPERRCEFQRHAVDVATHVGAPDVIASENAAIARLGC